MKSEQSDEIVSALLVIASEVARGVATLKESVEHGLCEVVEAIKELKQHDK